MAVIDAHFGILLPHLVDDATPHVSGVHQDVVLVDEGEVLLARGGRFEGVAHDALDTVGGVNADLGCDLVRGAHAHGAAVTAVEAFCAFTHDDEVDVAGVGQGAGHTLVVFGGTQVHVVVEGEAQLEQQASFKDSGGDGGVADCAEENHVVALDGLEVLVGERVAGGVPALGPQVEVGRGVVDALVCQDAIQDLEAFGDDLLADAVAGDYCDVQCHSSIFPRPRPRGGNRSTTWAVFPVTSPIDEAGAGIARTLPQPRLGQTDQIHAPEGAKKYQRPLINCQPVTMWPLSAK